MPHTLVSAPDLTPPILTGHQLSACPSLSLEDLECPRVTGWTVTRTLVPKPLRFGLEENKRGWAMLQREISHICGINRKQPHRSPLSRSLGIWVSHVTS